MVITMYGETSQAIPITNTHLLLSLLYPDRGGLTLINYHLRRHNDASNAVT